MSASSIVNISKKTLQLLSDKSGVFDDCSSWQFVIEVLRKVYTKVMEIIMDLVQSQFMTAVPVGLTIIACILLFTYGIRPAQQPKFKLGSLDDRKSASKKKKLKEKKPTLNGHVTGGLSKVEKSPVKELKKSPELLKKDKKVEPVARDSKKVELPKKVAEPIDKKKANKKSVIEKPADFDEGSWETVPAKGEKKKKVEPAPAKKEKKVKALVEPATEKSEIVVEEEAHEEAALEKALPTEVEEIPIIEEKKEKPKKAKPAKSPEAEIAAPPPQPIVQKEKTPVKVPEQAADSAKSIPTPSGAVFDELGDTWTEAKPVKKSKKKARRD